MSDLLMVLIGVGAGLIAGMAIGALVASRRVGAMRTQLHEAAQRAEAAERRTEAAEERAEEARKSIELERAWVLGEVRRIAASRSWRIGHGVARMGRVLVGRRPRQGDGAVERMILTLATREGAARPATEPEGGSPGTMLLVWGSTRRERSEDAIGEALAIVAADNGRMVVVSDSDRLEPVHKAGCVFEFVPAEGDLARVTTDLEYGAFLATRLRELAAAHGLHGVVALGSIDGMVRRAVEDAGLKLEGHLDGRPTVAAAPGR